MRLVRDSALAAALAACSSAAAETPPLWTDFVEARREGREPILPDFSYAGYHFSEKQLPDVSSRRAFDVTEYGATPDDRAHDAQAIQAAVDAAEAAGGGVVFFPPGQYLLSPDEERGDAIRIRTSNIVLKGSGPGEGGTELFLDAMRVGDRQIQFRPDSTRDRTITEVIADAPRERFWVEVAEPEELEVGQTVVLTHQSEAFTRQYFDPLPLAPEWTRLVGRRGGINIGEIHTIAEIDGARVRFENPIHFNLRLVGDEPFTLRTFPTIRECGIEGIRFSSNWKDYPEEFDHHKDRIHDGGWCAVSMVHVADSWVRDCEFANMNESLYLDDGYRVTIVDTDFTGKKGHSSVHARRGYGVLVKRCDFNGSHHHGPGGGYASVNLVITQCTMGVDQNIDSHSGAPMATLLDDIQGGVFQNCGGPHPGLPHHARGMVFWNFRHRSTDDYHYNFWSVDRRRNHTFARPVFVGFQADQRITFENEGVNQMPGEDVEPRSLFEAQLELRLAGDNSE